MSGDARFALALLGVVAACSEEPRQGFAPERNVGVEPTVGQSDAGIVPACPLLCDQADEATFTLSCASNDLASVTLTGPCAYSESGAATYVEQGHVHPWIKIASGRPGVCNVALLFANGFAYSADVTFTLLTNDGRPGCPPEPPCVVPSQPVFTVNNPSTTCLDAGPETEPDATADALPGCVGGCQ